MPLDLFIGARELVDEGPTLHGEGTQPGFDGFRGQLSICGDIEQIRLLHFELLQLCCQSSSGLSLPLLLHGERVMHMAPHLGSKARVKPQSAHFPSNGALNFLDWKVRKIACRVLAAATQEVSVKAALPVVRLGVDHSVLPPRFATPIAAHQPPQKVCMNLVSLRRPPASSKHLLNALEGLRRDECFVTPVEHLALVGHHPEVVGVAEKQAELVQRERTFLPLRRRTSRQALLCKLLAENRHAVLPRRVLLKGPPDERSPLRIDIDRVHQTSVEVPAHVEVADLGPTGGPAAHRLVEHLLLNVLAALPDLDFVHDVRDGLHGIGHVRA
nr:hypothetical protein [Microbacterium proteolyticum]